jgi:hypothetical protein
MLTCSNIIPPVPIVPIRELVEALIELGINVLAKAYNTGMNPPYPNENCTMPQTNPMIPKFRKIVKNPVALVTKQNSNTTTSPHFLLILPTIKAPAVEPAI